MPDETNTQAQRVRPLGTLANRTGFTSSSGRSAMAENASIAPVGTEGEFLAYRREGFRAAGEPVGTMPRPASVLGAATQAVSFVEGRNMAVLLDKIGERLAFERTGTRLYDTLLEKYETSGSYPGGPTREELEEIRDEEAEHFAMLARAVEQLDGDPTAVTPSADLAAVASSGLIQVLGDPRTRLGECLEAILIAELTDVDAWTGLAALAERLGHGELAASFRDAESEEEEHLDLVRTWVSARAELGGA